MKHKIIKTWIPAFVGMAAFIFLSSCSLFGGSSEPGGDASGSLIPSLSVVDFGSAETDPTYRSVSLTNNSSAPLTISKLLLSNNVCSAYYFYNAKDSYGNLLADSDDTLSAVVDLGETIYINMAYCPPDCSVIDNYETTLSIYSTDTNGQNYQSDVVLTHEVEVGIEAESPVICRNVLVCEEDPYEFTYKPVSVEESGELISTINDSSAAQDYYLQVNKIHGFIYPPAVPTNQKIIGSDIGLEDEDFVQPYLKINVDVLNQKTTLYKIDECSRFNLPSAETDLYFFGASTVLTTDEDIPTSFTLDGHLTLEMEHKITLLTLGIEGEPLSPLPDDNGTFQASIMVTLTTDKTEKDSDLGNMLEDDAYYDGVMNIVSDGGNKYHLEGTPLQANGSIRLVGKGKFIEDDFIGNSTVPEILFVEGDPAYLYVQIDATLVERVEALEE